MPQMPRLKRNAGLSRRLSKVFWKAGKLSK